MVDLSYASSAMEGNTYSWADAKALVEEGVPAAGKSNEETIMVLNHKEAVDAITGLFGKDALCPFSGLDKRLVREIHALLSNHLVPDQNRGAIRQQIVGIGGSAYIPETAPQVLDEDMGEICKKANEIRAPYERSFFVLVAVSYLQPFIDVNKRTGRLLASVPLLQAGLAPLSFMRVDNNRYKQGLIEFYEMQSTETVADVYLGAVLDSAARYKAVASLSADKKHLFVRNRHAIRSMIEAFAKSWHEGACQDIATLAVPETPDASRADDLREFVRSYVSAFSEDIARIDRYSDAEVDGLARAHAAFSAPEVPPPSPHRRGPR